MGENFLITNKTRRPIPKAPFVAIKNAILGDDYNLSLVLIGNSKSKKLNLIYRNKNKPTNVLSFPISKTEGEIFLDLTKIEKELRKFDTNFENHVKMLFIHGLLHLKGLDHGSTMESEEKKFFAKF